MPSNDKFPQIACTLGAAEHAGRMEWIADLNATALKSYRRDGHRIRLSYRPVAAAQARELVRRERQCCPFLHFSTEQEADAFAVIIDVPAGLGSVVDDVFASYVRPGGQAS